MADALLFPHSAHALELAAAEESAKKAGLKKGFFR